MKTVEVKLGKMRKPDQCVVYPRKPDSKLVIFQGERVIGAFDPDTRKGVINFTKNPNFVHLQALGVQRWEYTPEFVAECIGVQPKSGDVIGASDVCGVVVIA